MVVRGSSTNLSGSFSQTFKRGVGTPQRDVTLSYDDTLGVMRFQVTGDAGATCHWVGQVDITECGWWVG